MSQESFSLRVRVNKSDSAFLYFTLEANEGVCFYSTLEESLGTSYRDIHIQGSHSYKDELERILTHLSGQMTITRL